MRSEKSRDEKGGESEEVRGDLRGDLRGDFLGDCMMNALNGMNVEPAVTPPSQVLQVRRCDEFDQPHYTSCSTAGSDDE